MSEKQEWISAAAAVEILLPAMRLTEVTRTICKRAHVGLVRARAHLFIYDNKANYNVEVPLNMWWAQGGTALEQNWSTGDFETWLDREIRLQAFGVEFLHADIRQMIPPQAIQNQKVEAIKPIANKVFIGHGRSGEWLKLERFLKERLHLNTEEFNRTAAAGIPTVDRLKSMLDTATIAFIVMTGEDEQPGGKFHPRLNVVHEAGLFQGRLGFQRAIVLLEDGCEEFSNIHGLNQIRFVPKNIGSAFEEIRQTLEREGIIGPS